MIQFVRDLSCPHCGQTCEAIVLVEYDAMVDGPGSVETEERCESCSAEAA